MISFNNSIIDVVCLPFRGNYVTQDTDGHVARVHRGIDAQASIPTGKAKPALASQEPALTSRNGFPGGEEMRFTLSFINNVYEWLHLLSDNTNGCSPIIIRRYSQLFDCYTA